MEKQKRKRKGKEKESISCIFQQWIRFKSDWQKKKKEVVEINQNRIAQ